MDGANRKISVSLLFFCPLFLILNVCYVTIFASAEAEFYRFVWEYL